MSHSENCAGCSNRFSRYLCDQIFSIEDKLKIRQDFIEIYSNIVPNTPQSLRQKFNSQSQFNYFSKISNFEDYIKKYDPKKKTSRSLKFKQKVGFTSDIFGLIDAIFTLLAIPGLCIISITLFFLPLPTIIAIISSSLTIFLAILNLLSNIMVINVKLIKKFMENLFVRITDLENFGLKRDKKTIIGVFIWDSSICSSPYDVIKGFLILLVIKAISKRFYERLKLRLIKLMPAYISEHPQYPANNRHSLLLKFIWNQRKNL